VWFYTGTAEKGIFALSLGTFAAEVFVGLAVLSTLRLHQRLVIDDALDRTSL
jgi:hypothetical protein